MGGLRLESTDIWLAPHRVRLVRRIDSDRWVVHPFVHPFPRNQRIRGSSADRRAVSTRECARPADPVDKPDQTLKVEHRVRRDRPHNRRSEAPHGTSHVVIRGHLVGGSAPPGILTSQR